MKPRTKLISHRFLIPLIAAAVLTLAYVLANTWIENKIEKQLAAIPAKASVVSVNLFSRSVKLKELEIYPGRLSPYSVRLKKLILQGLDLHELWNNNKIVFLKLQVDSGKISYDRLFKGKSRPRRHAMKFTALAIQTVSFDNIAFEIIKDTSRVASFVANVHATNFSTNLDSLLAFSTEKFDGTFEKIMVYHGIKMYRLSIGKLAFNSQQNTIQIDSALLIPAYSKFAFAHVKGEQVGRINIAVPKLVIEGFNFSKVKDSTFLASKIKIESFDLHSFKDKRVPFLRDYRIPLPMESFLKVRFPISVDSLIIKDSRVTLEEITEKGAESGAVVINQINASCGKVTNNYKPGDAKFATLKASGFFMKAGEINATFLLPLDGSPVYYAKGSISGLPFEKLNTALENIARFRIESGKLNNLKFDFQYTDDKSTGLMEIDYEDLKITGLKRKKDDTSNLKTFLINAIIKDDTKDKNLSKLKRTGTINIERDKRRYIFNIWWKSILDGLGAAILGIGNPPKQDEKAKKSKKNEH
jgi:hypothetical protein